MGVQWRKVVSVPIWCWKKSWQGFSWRCSSNLILREQQLKEERHVRADTWTRSGLDRRGGKVTRCFYARVCVCVNDMKPQERVNFFMCSHALSLQTTCSVVHRCVCLCACVHVMEADIAEVRPPTLGELTRTCDSIQGSSSVSTAQRGVTMMTADVQ